MIEAVIFDMDGLLVDSEPFWRRAEMKVFRTVGIELTEDDCRETMGYRLNEVVDLWYARFPWQGPSKKDIETAILDHVESLILSEGVPLDGVLETVKSCAKMGVKMAVASSSPMRLIKATLNKLGITNFFEILHSAEFENFGKPHPAVFIHTAQELNCRPENCLVLEDSFHGMVAGLAAKMKVIAIPESKEDRYQASHLLLDKMIPSEVITFISKN